MIKKVFGKILLLFKKLFSWIKNIYFKIDGYIEDQIFYLFLFFSVQYFVYMTILDIIFGLDVYGNSLTPEIFSKIFIIYVFTLVLYKIYQTIKKYGVHSFLIFDFFAGFRFKYFLVYFECLVIETFLVTAYISIIDVNSDNLVKILIIFIIQKISISIMKNYLGKVLLNRKIEALNNGNKIKVNILEKTYSESIYLIDNLYSSMKKSLDSKYKSERLKTDLITNISHDIKTPLTSIINYVDLVKNSNNTEERNEYIKTLDYNAKRLKTMVIDLIDASKTGTGNIDLNYEIIELNELILQVYGQFDSAFEDKNLEFEYKSFSDNIFINVDGDQLSRVFENIITNAVKYCKENSTISIRIEVKDSKLMVSISNISKEPLVVKSEDLLEQFVRGEQSRSSEGSGLGLYISKNLIELMKGKFEINIEEDIFTVIISFKIKTNKKKIG
ncbi:sensor histidine kinase [Miniphocaeibacter massiliensis]|uniref:sensor histidine kinase n=1 Tax=Miniphocaeibacter massiliensis TaxID=2041841 RepID=UPI000C082552|nr:HAMP domain-containing sensor histidine kinase [Miniphocaeibacter massiliensis]